MNDQDGPTVARFVYEELARSYPNINPDSIPFALDAAVRKLRADGAYFHRWATYIHMGV
jgi:hypothetical protein